MRKFVSIVLASVFAFFLFALMNLLIDNEVQAVDSKPAPVIDFNTETDPEKLKKIIREPKPKKELPKIKPLVEQPAIAKPEAPPAPTKPIKSITGPTVGSDLIDVVNYDRGGTTLAGVPAIGGGFSPTIRIEPQYPRKAAINNVQGSVTLQFDIDKDGNTKNIRVIDATPKGYFEQSSRKAVSKWRYNVKKEDGSPVEVEGQVVTLDFKLES